MIAKAGTVLGHDDGEPVTTPYDNCVLVMPSSNRPLRARRHGCSVGSAGLTPGWRRITEAQLRQLHDAQQRAQRAVDQRRPARRCRAARPRPSGRDAPGPARSTTSRPAERGAHADRRPAACAPVRDLSRRSGSQWPRRSRTTASSSGIEPARERRGERDADLRERGAEHEGGVQARRSATIATSGDVERRARVLAGEEARRQRLDQHEGGQADGIGRQRARACAACRRARSGRARTARGSSARPGSTAPRSRAG